VKPAKGPALAGPTEPSVRVGRWRLYRLAIHRADQPSAYRKYRLYDRHFL